MLLSKVCGNRILLALIKCAHSGGFTRQLNQYEGSIGISLFPEAVQQLPLFSNGSVQHQFVSSAREVHVTPERLVYGYTVLDHTLGNYVLEAYQNKACVAAHDVFW